MGSELALAKESKLRTAATRTGRRRPELQLAAVPNQGGEMQTIGIVLNVGSNQVEAFERGFRDHELPTWLDLEDRGLLIMATLTRLDISTRSVDGAVQYLVVAIFRDDRGHREHDHDPRFEAWNTQADAYQVAEPFVFGGDTIVHAGPQAMAG
jgi:hypothetical protein